MVSNFITNTGSKLIESVASTGVLTAALDQAAPREVAKSALPISGLFAAVNAGLVKVLHVDEKPKIVQVVFPFFSGLAAVALIPAIGLPTVDILGTYIFCSTLMAGIALIKVAAKSIFKKHAEPREESTSHRVFNYITSGAASVVPAFIAGALIKSFTGQDSWVLGTVGVFFGLAQTMTSTILGASKESRVIQAFVPVATCFLPFVICGSMENVPNGKDIFVPVIALSLITSFVGTVAVSCFRGKPSEPVEAATRQDENELRHNYRRDSALVQRSGGWVKGDNGWKQKAK